LCNLTVSSAALKCFDQPAVNTTIFLAAQRAEGSDGSKLVLRLAKDTLAWYECLSDERECFIAKNCSVVFFVLGNLTNQGNF
jgi:hypothetical protein